MKRELSEAAKTAKAIKQELKKAYPNIVFKVTSENFSMGDSVGARWVDGPTEKAVREITDKYQYGHFNGMEDIYEDSNRNDDIPQAKYVTAARDISYEVYLDALIKARDYLPGFYAVTELDTTLPPEDVNDNITARQRLWRYLNACDLSQGFRPTMLHADVWNDGAEPVEDLNPHGPSLEDTEWLKNTNEAAGKELSKIFYEAIETEGESAVPMVKCKDCGTQRFSESSGCKWCGSYKLTVTKDAEKETNSHLCLGCGHRWAPRVDHLTPSRCPSCKDEEWDKPISSLARGGSRRPVNSRFSI